MAMDVADPRNKGPGYARRFLRITNKELDENETREAIRDHHDFENAHYAPHGQLTLFMNCVISFDKETFLEYLRKFDDKWAIEKYKRMLLDHDVDCAETFVHEHTFGYVQHMEDNYYGIPEAKGLSFLQFEGGFDWHNLRGFKEFGLRFLEQAVATCEDNEDTENQRDKHAILSYAKAKRAEERSKRAKLE